MNSSPLIVNSETEVELPKIVGPTPPKRNASDRSERRLTLPDTGGDQDSFACFDRDLLRFNTPTSADTPHVGFFVSARASMARSVQVNSTAPASGRTTRTVSSPAASNSPLPGLPLSTSTPAARSSFTSNSDHPVNSKKSSSSHRSHSADSGVYDAHPDMATSLQQIITQLQESNQEMKELTRQMKDIDKRVHTLEDEDADHEGDGGPDKKRAKKRKCRANSPSKDVRNLVRRTSTALKEAENNDTGFEWDVSLRFDNPCNQAVMTKLAEEVKALNPATPSTAVRDAAHTYFSSLTL